MISNILNVHGLKMCCLYRTLLLFTVFFFKYKLALLPAGKEYFSFIRMFIYFCVIQLEIVLAFLRKDCGFFHFIPLTSEKSKFLNFSYV